MKRDDQYTPDFAALTEHDIDSTTLFDVFASRRRRGIIACLQEYTTPMALADIADELAAYEHDAPITEIPPEAVKTIYLDLYHCHIPKLVDAEIVEYTQDRDLVALAENAEELPTQVEFPSIIAD